MFNGWKGLFRWKTAISKKTFYEHKKALKTEDNLNVMVTHDNGYCFNLRKFQIISTINLLVFCLYIILTHIPSPMSSGIFSHHLPTKWDILLHRCFFSSDQSLWSPLMELPCVNLCYPQ